MGVDPVSLLVASLVVAALVQRVPGIVAQFAEQASQGDSDEDSARAERLKNAGFEPATGGPARRFFGNLWRDAWLDLDEKRQASRDARTAKRAAAEADADRSWLDKLADKMDAKVTDTTGRWRTQPGDDPKRPGVGGRDPKWTPPAGHDGVQWPDEPAGGPTAPPRPDDSSGGPEAGAGSRARPDVPTSRPPGDNHVPHRTGGPLAGTLERDNPPAPDRPTPAMPWTHTDRGEEGARRRDHRAASDNFPPTGPAAVPQQARGAVVGTLERDDPQPVAPPALGAQGAVRDDLPDDIDEEIAPGSLLIDRDELGEELFGDNYRPSDSQWDGRGNPRFDLDEAYLSRRHRRDNPSPPPPNSPAPATGGAGQQARGPVVGTLERNDPPQADQPAPVGAAPPVIEGEVVTDVARRGGAVTGVVSGAAEARAIQRAVDEANAAYIAAMARIRARIIHLGEQTLAEVQMAARSDVVQHTAQAAEAAASAQAHARSVGSEVGPLLGAVARAFNRRNS